MKPYLVYISTVEIKKNTVEIYVIVLQVDSKVFIEIVKAETIRNLRNNFQ